MRNLELKVSYPAGLEHCRSLLINLVGPELQGSLSQKDTYFHLPNGVRLKLRQILLPEPPTAQLISYRRPDVAGTRTSDFLICEIENVDGMLAVLQLALGPPTVVVEKAREVWIWDHTRIHLDIVRGLGEFIELETTIDCRQEHGTIKSALVLDKLCAIAGSYSDLLSARARKAARFSKR